VNATGPWLDRVAATIGGHLPRSIRTTKGIHVVCPPLTGRALVLFSRVDRRLMFAIPRLGQTWLGTTDTDYSGDPADAVATLDDVEYVLESLRDVFPSLTVDDVLYTTAGVRALVMQGGRATTVSRLHQVVDGERAGVPGLIAIMGGKLTAYRAIAEEATDAICRRLHISRRAATADEPLPGARGFVAAGPDVPAHLHDLYGSCAFDVLRLAAERPDLARPLSPKYPDIGAQVAFAARHEWCLTIADFLRRRSVLGAAADQGWDAAPAVAAILAQELGWTDDRRDREIEACALDIEKSQSFRALPRPRGPEGLPR
jgi:glycerol-3-phosphate dehydrogenase